MQLDQLFKETLREFFGDFLTRFFPEQAARLDLATIRFLDKETFTDFPEGSSRDADLVAEVRTREGAPELVLVHVEVQQQRRADFRFRMWQYYALLRLRHGVPVLPVALYLTPGVGGITTEVYEEETLGLRTLRYRYLAVGLPDLSAEEFQETPFEAALSAAMPSREANRARRKFRILQTIAVSELNDAHKTLLATVLETLLPFQNQTEQTEFQTIVAVEGRQEVKTMTTVYDLYQQRGWESGMERGLEQGLEQGLEKGLEKGLQAQRNLILEALELRFGPASAAAREKLAQLKTDEELRDALRRVITAATLAETGLTGA